MEIYFYFMIFILFIFLLIFLFFVYIRIKFPFWALQPVFHVYDFQYLFYPKGIINMELPEKNKYTNFINIETIDWSKIPEYKLSKFIYFIQNNYLHQGQDKFFYPKKENILPYFKSHNQISFLSFYHKNELIHDSKNDLVINYNKCIGVMSSRPVHIFFKQKNKFELINAYYVDYLCVHPNYRKQNIAPEIIQTHEYNQRHNNKKIIISIFKREGELTGIIPLTVFNTYGFSVKKWIKPPELPSFYTLLEINTQNISYLHDFLKNQQHQGLFDIFIQTELSNIIELIKTNNIFIYCILFQDQIVCAYFFRKSCVFYKKDLEILTCIGSIQSFDFNKESIFIHGFKSCFWKIAFQHHFGYAAIENISHNNIIINNLIKKIYPDIISPTAYFFFNFAYSTFPSKKTFILL